MAVRCGSCQGRHDTVAEVRACHATPGNLPPVAPAPVPAPAGDPFDQALAVLAAAGLAHEVLFVDRRSKWALSGRS